MKKLILSFVITALACSSSMAQFNAGAGYLNQITKSESEVKSGMNGFYVGASYELYLGSGFSFEPGVYYEYSLKVISNGVDIIIEGTDFLSRTVSSHYLNIPWNFYYYPLVGTIFDVFAYAGPQLKIGLASQSTEEYLNSDAVKLDNYGDVKGRLDLGMGLGAGIDILDFVRVKFGYAWGLVNLNDSATKLNDREWKLGVALIF